MMDIINRGEPGFLFRKMMIGPGVGFPMIPSDFSGRGSPLT